MRPDAGRREEEAIQFVQVTIYGGQDQGAKFRGQHLVEHSEIENFKSDVHRILISKLDLEKLSRVNSGQAKQAVASMIDEIIVSLKVPLSFEQQEKVEADLLDEVFGLGPLEALLKDPRISDILVNDKDHVFVERGGILEQVDTSFRDDRHLLQIIDRIVSRVGRRVDESSPMVDARLPDGSRVNAIIPPLALDGPALSIRRGAGTTGRVEEHLAGDDGGDAGCGARAHQHPGLGRNGRGQDDLPEHSVAVHSQERAHCDDRRRRRIAACDEQHRALRDAAAEHRGQRRGAPAAASDQQPAHAARPHHHWRGARRRGVRHAAGDEYRP